jgi:hypothetical protein
MECILNLESILLKTVLQKFTIAKPAAGMDDYMTEVPYKVKGSTSNIGPALDEPPIPGMQERGTGAKNLLTED